MWKDLRNRLIIKVLLPTILSMFFLWLMVQGNEANKPEVYNFNPEEIGNATAVGIEEFKVSMNTKSDSIFLFCSNEDKNCYNLLNNLKELNIEVEYVNVLELVDSEKEELKNYSMFTNELYPKLIIIKNKTVTFYDNFLSKEELDKIL